MQAMRAKYPTDRFEVTLRKINPTSTPEWRIKCQDCPGKVSFFFFLRSQFFFLIFFFKTVVHSGSRRDVIELRSTFEKSDASLSCERTSWKSPSSANIIVVVFYVLSLFLSLSLSLYVYFYFCFFISFI